MEARCSCGSLQLGLPDDPLFVVACHCIACQRRSGSVFGVGAYYRADSVTMRGAARIYVRESEEGGSVTTHFCPTCGTSMSWRNKHANLIGVAVGTIVGGMRMPHYSVWEQTRHAWVDVQAVPVRVVQGAGSAVVEPLSPGQPI